MGSKSVLDSKVDFTKFSESTLKNPSTSEPFTKSIKELLLLFVI